MNQLLAESSAMIGVLLLMALFIAVFILIREIINWYWRINERIRVTYVINLFFRKSCNQFGVSPDSLITVEEIKTRKRAILTVADWCDFRLKSNNKYKYRVVNCNYSDQKVS